MGNSNPSGFVENAEEKAPSEYVPEDKSWVGDYALQPGQEHFGMLPDHEQLVRCGRSGVSSAEERPPCTLLGLFADACASAGDTCALAVERPCPASADKAPTLEWDAWTKWTYNEVRSDANKFAKACCAVGTVQHESVAVWGFNSPEWLLAFWGSIHAGAKCVGIYPTDTSDQVAYKLEHARCRVIALEDAGKLKKVSEKIKSGDIKCLKAIVVWGCDPPAGGKVGDVPVYTWEAWMEHGAEQDDSLAVSVQAKIKPGHCAVVVYTSGTTGNPKGVMLSHDALWFCGSNIMTVTKLMEAKEHRTLSYLPISHIAGLAVDALCPACITSQEGMTHTVYFARPYDLKDSTIVDRLKFVKPTIFLGVPRVYEKMMEKLLEVGKSLPAPVKAISDFAKSCSKEVLLDAQIGRGKRGASLSIMAPLMDKTILNSVRGKLGLDCAELCITGAAPMAKHIYEYFASLGIKIQEAYGMSETTGLSAFNYADCFEFGTVGVPMLGMEVDVFKVSDADFTQKTECGFAADLFNPSEDEQGEICFRGRCVMSGYLANPAMGDEEDIRKKNATCVDKDGWLHSGDKGCKGKNGMLRITGRYKELIIGAGGENVAPVGIEDNVKRLCPALSNVMMVGDHRKYNTMLVTLKCQGYSGELPGTNVLTGAAKELSKDSTTIEDAQKDPAWKAAIDKAITDTNNDPMICQNAAWKVQKWAILPRDFSVETGEFTATLKLKRGDAQKAWAGEIDKLY